MSSFVFLHTPPIVLPGAPHIPPNPVAPGSYVGTFFGFFFGALLFASWSAPGGSWGRKKLLLNGSWRVLENFQDRFQPSWGPKGSPKGGQKAPKSSPRGDSSSKWRNLENCRTSHAKSLIFRSQGSILEGKIDLKCCLEALADHIKL